MRPIQTCKCQRIRTLEEAVNNLKRLKELRQRYKFMIRDLAQFVGVSEQTVCNWEAQQSSPKAPLLIRVDLFLKLWEQRFCGCVKQTIPVAQNMIDGIENDEAEEARLREIRDCVTKHSESYREKMKEELEIGGVANLSVTAEKSSKTSRYDNVREPIEKKVSQRSYMQEETSPHSNFQLSEEDQMTWTDTVCAPKILPSTAKLGVLWQMVR